LNQWYSDISKEVLISRDNIVREAWRTHYASLHVASGRLLLVFVLTGSSTVIDEKIEKLSVMVI
jgi:uncharacterized iron-regulated membrane protein